MLTYCGEVWDLNKGQANELNGILNNILNRILKVPHGTLRGVLYIETSLLIPTTIITKEHNKYGNNDKMDWKQITVGTSIT